MSTKAILYARFSPRQNHETSESCEYQLDEMRQYADKQGWEIVGEYKDLAVSGDSLDRPGLWGAIEALRAGYVLVAYRLDRIARDVYLSCDIERQVKDRRARIVSVCGEGTWEETEEQRLIRRILQALAEYEKKRNAARTKAAMLSYQANGRRMSAEVPYGWMEDPDSPIHTSGSGHVGMIRNPIEQEVIDSIVTMRTELGCSLREIARRLRRADVPARRGEWRHKTVKAILKREGVD